MSKESNVKIKIGVDYAYFVKLAIFKDTFLKCGLRAP